MPRVGLACRLVGAAPGGQVLRGGLLRLVIADRAELARVVGRAGRTQVSMTCHLVRGVELRWVKWVDGSGLGLSSWVGVGGFEQACQLGSMGVGGLVDWSV